MVFWRCDVRPLQLLLQPLFLTSMLTSQVLHDLCLLLISLSFSFSFLSFFWGGSPKLFPVKRRMVVCMESMFYAVGGSKNPKKQSQQTIMSSVSVYYPCHGFDDGNEDGGKSLFQVLGSWHPQWSEKQCGWHCQAKDEWRRTHLPFSRLFNPSTLEVVM